MDTGSETKKAEEKVAEGNGQKLRKITLTITREENGNFRFHCDDLGDIYAMESFLKEAGLRLSRLIRREENILLEKRLADMVKDLQKGTSRIVDPFTKKPLKVV